MASLIVLPICIGVMFVSVIGITYVRAMVIAVEGARRFTERYAEEAERLYSKRGG